MLHYRGIHVSSTLDQWRRYHRIRHGSRNLRRGRSGHVSSQGCTFKYESEFYELGNPLQPSATSIPVAIIIGVASDNALLYVGHDEGIHKVTLTFVCLVTIPSWATKSSINVD